MSEITKPIMLDETGQSIKTQLAANNPSSQLTAIAQSLAQIATSSNAAQTLAQLAKTIADEANSIAKGATVAQVFDTEALMNAWIKNSANKGKLKVGDNLYIKAVDVPDYWVSAVLQTPNASGAYYEVSQLETGKVDLNDVVSASSDEDTTINYAYGQHGNVSKRISAANLASVVAGVNCPVMPRSFNSNWDINDMIGYTFNGIYFISSNAKGTLPSGFDKGVFVCIAPKDVGWQANSTIQILANGGIAAAAKIYIRTNWASTFSPWKEF